ncbi:MAG: hypothetical protein AB8H47_14210 [Bacteroidia bacterium]
MYSVRSYTRKHGSTNLNILIANILATAALSWYLSIDYLIIYCSSSLVHLIIESGLSLSGIRKGGVYVYGRKLPRIADVFLRALVEGPAFCIPAFFVADHFMSGQIEIGIGAAVLMVGLGSLYMGFSDRNNLRQLGPEDEALLSRRAMTRPGAVMLLALINTGCLAAFFLMPAPYRAHAFAYLIAYALLVMLFYLINYNLGVRMIELYDAKEDKFNRPGPVFQAAALTYDSAYEMALLISPAYWLTFYLGFFHYATIA